MPNNNITNIYDSTPSATNETLERIRLNKNNVSPSASISRVYDRESVGFVDDYEELYALRKLSESDGKEYNWAVDAYTSLANSKDNIKISALRDQKLTNIDPYVSDISYISGVLNSVKDEENPNNKERIVKENLEAFTKAYENIYGKEGDPQNLLQKAYSGYSINEELQDLENRKSNLEKERKDIDDDILELEQDIKERGLESLEYQLRKRRAQERNDIFSAEYYKYAVPELLGSSLSSNWSLFMGIGTAVLQKVATSMAAGFMAGATTGAGVGAVAGGVGAGPGAVVGAGAGTIAGLFTGLVNASSLAANIWAINKDRQNESHAESYETYKQLIQKDLQDHNKYDKLINSIRKNLTTEQNVAYNDDQLLDKAISKEIPLDDPDLIKTLDESKKKNLESARQVYKGNMYLAASDFAQQVLMFNGVASALKSVGGKAARLSGLDKVYNRVAKDSKFAKKINKKIDDYIDFNTSLMVNSPTKSNIKLIAGKLGKLGFKVGATGLLEGMEEGDQFNLSRKMQKEPVDESSYAKAFSDIVNAKWSTVKGITGIDDTLSNDKEFWQNINGGMVLGGLMGAAPNIISTAISTRNELKTNSFVRDAVIDQLSTKNLFEKTKLYSSFYNSNKGSANVLLSTIDSLKRLTKLDDSIFTEEDINEDLKIAKRTINDSLNPEITELRKALGYKKNSEEFNTLLGLRRVRENELDKTLDDKIQNDKEIEAELKRLDDDFNATDAGSFADNVEMRSAHRTISNYNMQWNAHKRLTDEYQALLDDPSSTLTEAQKKYFETLLAYHEIEKKKIADNLLKFYNNLLPEIKEDVDIDYVASSGFSHELYSRYKEKAILDSKSDALTTELHSLKGELLRKDDTRFTRFSKLNNEEKERAKSWVDKQVRDTIQNSEQYNQEVQEESRVRMQAEDARRNPPTNPQDPQNPQPPTNPPTSPTNPPSPAPTAAPATPTTENPIVRGSDQGPNSSIPTIPATPEVDNQTNNQGKSQTNTKKDKKSDKKKSNDNPEQQFDDDVNDRSTDAQFDDDANDNDNIGGSQFDDDANDRNNDSSREPALPEQEDGQEGYSLIHDEDIPLGFPDEDSSEGATKTPEVNDNQKKTPATSSNKDLEESNPETKSVLDNDNSETNAGAETKSTETEEDAETDQTNTGNKNKELGNNENYKPTKEDKQKELSRKVQEEIDLATMDALSERLLVLEEEIFGNRDKVSHTCFYVPSSTRNPKGLEKYETGKSLSEFLNSDKPEDKEALAKAQFVFVVDDSYKDPNRPYVKGDKSTYDGAGIIVEMYAGGKVYYFTLRQPPLSNPSPNDPEADAAINRLITYRNEIIETFENKGEDEVVVPTSVKRTHGRYEKNTKVKDGKSQTIRRPIQEVKGLKIKTYTDDEGNIRIVVPKFGIGEGMGHDGTSNFAIVDGEGFAMPGRGGSGQLFVEIPGETTKSGYPTTAQVDVMRFNEKQAEALLDLLILAVQPRDVGNMFYSDLLHFIVRLGEETLIDTSDPRFDFLAEKQLNISGTTLYVGKKVYPNINALTREDRKEIIASLQKMHWRINKDTFFGKLSNIFSDTGYFYMVESLDFLNKPLELLPGVTLTKEQFNSGMTVAEFMMQNNLIQSELSDRVMIDPFTYVDGVATIKGDFKPDAALATSQALSQPEVTGDPVNDSVGETSISDYTGLPALNESNTETQDETQTDEDVSDEEGTRESGVSAEEEEEVKKLLKRMEAGESLTDIFLNDLGIPVDKRPPAEDTGAPRSESLRTSIENITEKEIKWLSDNLGLTSDQIEVVERLIAVGGDMQAMGVCREDSIVLYKNAEIGTAYHEAFHRVSLLLLTKKERQRIYDMYRTKHNLLGLSDKEVEEALAEEFRQYKLNNTQSNLNIVKRMFNSIKNFISKWVFKSDTNLDNIFNRINSGYFRKYKVNQESLNEFRENYTNGAPFRCKGVKFKYITNPQFNEIVNSLLAQTLISNHVKSRESAKEISFDKIKAKFNPNILKFLLKRNEITQERYNILSEIYNNFDIFKYEINRKLKHYQIKEIDTLDAQNDAIQDRADGNAVADSMAYLNKETIEISVKNNALAAVKIFIATLPKTRYNKEGKLEQVVSPITGLPLLEDYDEAMTLALNVLRDCQNLDEILATCEKWGKTYPMFAQLHSKIIEYTNVKPTDTQAEVTAKENLATQLRNTFRKAKNNIIGIISYIRNGKPFDIVVKTENSEKEAKDLVDGWFVEMLNSNHLIGWSESDGYHLQKKQLENIKSLKTIAERLYKIGGIFKSKDFKGSTEVAEINKYLNYVLNVLQFCGVKIDRDTLTSFINENYNINNDFTEAFGKFLADKKRTGLHYFLSNTVQFLENVESDGKYTKIVNGKIQEGRIDKIFNYSEFLKNIAKAYSINNPSPTETTVVASGKLLYSISEHNYLTDTTESLDKDSSFIDDLLGVTYVTGKREAGATFIKGSSIINNLLKLKGKFGKIKVGTFAYFKQNGGRDIGRSYSEVSPVEDYIFKMALINSGHMLLPTMGDSAVYNTLYGDAVKTFKNPLEIVVEGDNVSIKFPEEVLQQFIGYFETELDTIISNYNNEEFIKNHPEHVIQNYHTGARNGYRFRYFGGFLHDAVKGDFNSLNEALIEAEALDEKAGGGRVNVSNILSQISETWNKMSHEEKSNAMNDLLKVIMESELNYAEQLGLIRWDHKNLASVRNVSLPSSWITKATKVFDGQFKTLGISSHPIVTRKLAALQLVSNFTFNYIMSNIEFEKLYVKDPAFYKDASDKIKRLRECLSTGVSPRTDLVIDPTIDETKVVVGTLNDNVFPSRELTNILDNAYKSIAFKRLVASGKTVDEAKELVESNNIPEDVATDAKEITQKMFGGYSEVNQTDATVLISPKFYERLVRRVYGWTDEIAEAFRLLNDPDSDVLADREKYLAALKTSLKPLKFMYFGDHFDKTLGLDVPIFDKMAMFPVHRIFSTGDMAEIFKRMTSETNPVDMFAFKSAVKTGIHVNEATDMYTDPVTGELNVEGIQNAPTHTQLLKNFRSQLITDPHHASTQMFVTQAQKAAIGNIRSGITYLTPSGESLTGTELRDKIVATMNALTKFGVDKISKEMGISRTEDGITVNQKKVLNVLQKDALQSDANQNVVEGLTMENGKPRIPLSALSDVNFIETRIMSLFNKNIIDNYLPGGMFIQMSSIAYNKIKVTEDSGSRKLNFNNADGTMDAVISINLLKHIIPDYDSMTFEEAKSWLIKNKIIGTENDVSPVGMGYRIPAQGQSSTIALRIVDVYPEQIGDTVTLPDDFTALTGSDFD